MEIFPELYKSCKQGSSLPDDRSQISLIYDNLTRILIKWCQKIMFTFTLVGHIAQVFSDHTIIKLRLKLTDQNMLASPFWKVSCPGPFSSMEKNVFHTSKRGNKLIFCCNFEQLLLNFKLVTLKFLSEIIWTFTSMN